MKLTTDGAEGLKTDTMVAVTLLDRQRAGLLWSGETSIQLKNPIGFLFREPGRR